MIKQEVVKAMSESKCIEKAKPIIERYKIYTYIQ